MAQKDIQFNQILSPAPDPVSPNGQLLVSAGTMEGQAAQTRATGQAIASKTQGELLSTAASTALDAYKGKLSANMETGLRQTIDAYESSVNFDKASTELEFLTSGMGGEAPPEAVAAATAKMEKYRAALKQGTMSREQALLALDATVKDYSNQMPGWASEFRKQAATITGNEHMGNYKEHMLLAANASADAKAKAMAEAQQKLLNKFIDKYGRMPNKPGDMSTMAASFAMEAKVNDLKNEISLRDSTIIQNEPKALELINLTLADGMMTLNTHLQGIVGAVDPKTGKPMPPQDRVVVRERMVSDINVFFQGLQSQVLRLNNNQISVGEREKQLSRIETQRKTMMDSLSNQDNFDSFTKLMDVQSKTAKNVVDKWAIANPQLEIIRHSGGVMSPLASQWMQAQQDPRTASDFARRMPGLNSYFSSVLAGDPKQYADSYVKGTTDMEYNEALKKTNAPAWKEAVAGAAEGIRKTAREGFGQTPETQELRKKNFANWVDVLGNNLADVDQSIRKEWLDLMGNPNIAKVIKELPADQKGRVAMTIASQTRNILVDPDMGLMKKLGTLVEKESGDNAVLDIRFNSITNKFEGVMNVTKKGQGLVPTGQIPVSTDVRDTLDKINKAIGIFDNIKDVKGAIPEDLVKRGVAKDFFNKFSAGFFNLPQEDRALSFEDVKNSKVSPLPKNEKNLRSDMTRELPALSEAEIKLNIINVQDELQKVVDPYVKRILNQELISLQDQLKKANKENTTNPK